MTKFLITALILWSVFYVGKQLTSTYKDVKKNSLEAQQEGASGNQKAVSGLQGMHPSLEPALQAAKNQGAAGLAKFLEQYRYSIRDPRLADIELDYVVLLNLQNRAEAQRVFKSIQQRVPSSSPVYERIKKLEKSYQ